MVLCQMQTAAVSERSRETSEQLVFCNIIITSSNCCRLAGSLSALLKRLINENVLADCFAAAGSLGCCN